MNIENQENEQPNTTNSNHLDSQQKLQTISTIETNITTTPTLAMPTTTVNSTTKFRFASQDIHLTYSGHQPHEELIEYLRSYGKGWDWYSVVHETSDDGYEHTHFAGRWKKRVDRTKPNCFDFRNIHPNIRTIDNKSHAVKIFTEYHKKAPLLLTQSENGPNTYRKSDLQQIQEAKSLWAAAELMGIKPKSIADLKQIRDDKELSPDFKHTFNENWILQYQFDRVLFMHGPTGTGKTQWALAQFDNPLLVCTMDDLRRFTKGKHDGIVFDDMSFAHIPREACIHLLDWDQERSIHCRYSPAIIPAKTKKIFVSNKLFNEVFPYDESGAIARRVTNHLHIKGPTFVTPPTEIPDGRDRDEFVHNPHLPGAPSNKRRRTTHTETPNCAHFRPPNNTSETDGQIDNDMTEYFLSQIENHHGELDIR